MRRGQDEGWLDQVSHRGRPLVASCTFSGLPSMRRKLTSAQPDDTAEALGSRLEANWTKRREAIKAHEKAVPGGTRTRPSLTGALVASFGGPFFIAAVFKVR